MLARQQSHSGLEIAARRLWSGLSTSPPLLRGMAAWEEKDSRWIVDERKDGTNVNQWHWEEKNVTEWARHRLDELFRDSKVTEGEGGVTAVTKGIDSLSGDAYLNQRKGRLIPGYEMEVKVQYEGQSESGTSKGQIHFPYIADENADEDPEIRIVPDGSASADSEVKASLSRKINRLKETIKQWEKEMSAGGPFSSQNASSSAAKKAEQALSNSQPSQPSASTPKQPSSRKAGRITLREEFYCRPMDIYQCLTEEHRVKAFTQSDSHVDPQPGGAFSMFDGNVHGTFVELIPGEKLVQKWRFRDWPEEWYSDVKITFEEPEHGKTFLVLEQTNLPAADKFGNETVFDSTENGWKSMICHKIRKVFGFGA